MHPRVLSNRAWKIVKTLSRLGLLEGWTLAGGTGLALQLGHRYSDDLGLFRPENFDSRELLNVLSPAGFLHVQGMAPSTLHVLVDGVRFSFLQCRPPLLFDGLPYRGLTVADPRDSAVMKIAAVGSRGSRKDFIDLHFYLESGGSLDAIFSLLKRRFTGIGFNRYHLLKSLVYFEDA